MLEKLEDIQCTFPTCANKIDDAIDVWLEHINCDDLSLKRQYAAMDFLESKLRGPHLLHSFHSNWGLIYMSFLLQVALIKPYMCLRVWWDWRGLP